MQPRRWVVIRCYVPMRGWARAVVERKDGESDDALIIAMMHQRWARIANARRLSIVSQHHAKSDAEAAIERWANS